MTQTMTGLSSTATISVIDLNGKLRCKHWLHITDQPVAGIPQSVLEGARFHIVPTLQMSGPGTVEPFMARACSFVRYESLDDVPATLRILCWGALEPPDGREIVKPAVYLMERI